MSRTDLDERLRLRDLILGEDAERRRELHELLAAGSRDRDLQELVDDLAPVIARLEESVERHLPFGTPREAVDYTLSRASGFSVASVTEYCGGSERTGGSTVDDIRRLLADEVVQGRLSVNYVFDCPSCGNVIDGCDELPDGPLTVFCDHNLCRTERTLDPATAHAIFINANEDPALKSWI